MKHIYRYIKSYWLFSIYVLIGVTIGSVLFSCSDDLDIRNNIGDINQGGIVEINFAIPEAEHVVLSRADNDDLYNERKLDNVALFIFNEEGSKLLQRTDVSPLEMSGYDDSIEGKRAFSYTLKLTGEAVYENNPKILAIANTNTGNGDLFGDFKSDVNISESELKEVISSDRYYKNHTSGAFLMSGEYEASNKIIYLYRTAAKITLKDYFQKKEIFHLVEDEKNNFSTYNIYKTASSSYAAAWLRDIKYTNSNAEGAKITESSILRKDETGSKRYDSYVNPTKTHEGNNIWTYIVIHGNYQGTEGYYAVALKDSNGHPLDILPNNWYEMRLKEVSVPGYIDENTALANPFETGIVVEIHDHAPNVLSMISDGIHELGATYSIELDNNAWNKPLNVKCLTKDDEDDFNFSDLNVKVVDGTDWIKIEYKEEIKKQGTDRADDQDDFGHQYEYTVSAPRHEELYTDREGEILVTWKGLERRVKVTYNATFLANNVCDVELTIKNYSKDHSGSEVYDPFIIKDYWKFIGGLGKSKNMSSNDNSEENTPRLFGITPEELSNERVRNEGFHFPMPYGTKTLSEYEYKIDLTKLVQEGKEISTVTGTVIDDNLGFFRNYLNGCDGNGVIEGSIENGRPIIKLSMKKIVDPADIYIYTTAKINLEITYKNDSDPSFLPLDLYHTGFFHYTNDSKYFPVDDQGYYYYAVPTLNGRPWLDRNIGAKSSTRFGSRANNVNIGKADAGGKYFSITEEPELYKDAVIDESMCPPGYKIPSSSEWNDIRLSGSLKTQNRNVNGEIYMSTYFDTGSDQMGDVFFQKGRFYNKTNSYYNTLKTVDYGKANSGDDLSGYYWTSTIAPSTEKEQMGKWLRVLYFNGASTSYINGSILDHKYYIRCTAIDDEYVQTDKYLSFNVHNATHVYLFAYEYDSDTDKATITPMYTFPGHTLGTTLSAKQWQYFYTTTSIDLNKIYVVFTKQQEDGSIMVYTIKRTDDGNIDLNNFNKSTYFGDDILNPTYAWSVVEFNHHYFDFCDVSFEHSTSNYIYRSEDEKDKKIESKDCSGNIYDNGIPKGEDGGGDVTPGETFKNGDTLKFLWPKTIKGKYYPNYFAWCSRNGGNYILTTNHTENWDDGISATSDGDYYTYQHTLEETMSFFTVRVYTGKFDYVKFEIKIDSNANRAVIEHEGNLTSGGSITAPNRDANETTWIIQLYDYDNVEGGEEPEEGLPDGGEGQVTLFDKNSTDSQIIWEGSFAFGRWNNFEDLSDNKFNWQDVPENSTLTIDCIKRDDDPDNWWQLVLKNGYWTDLPNQKIENPDKKVEIRLSGGENGILTNLQKNNGLKISGYYTIITKFTITPPNN